MVSKRNCGQERGREVASAGALSWRGGGVEERERDRSATVQEHK
jgi:hypothetical protein